MAIMDQDALNYHKEGRPGKTEVVPTKPCLTARDLSLAYSPGVAIPCTAIEKNPHDAYLYTNRGNLVAVVSNGTAVLGLGNIGALAGKPVMEGKGVLFKKFGHVDVFDIEVGSEDPQEVKQRIRGDGRLRHSLGHVAGLDVARTLDGADGAERPAPATEEGIVGYVGQNQKGEIEKSKNREKL